MSTLWFEVAVVSTLFALGNIVFGHFEAGTPRWRRVAKMAVVMAIAVSLSAYVDHLTIPAGATVTFPAPSG